MQEEFFTLLDQIWTFFYNFFFTLGDRIKGLINSVVPEEILPTE